MSGGMKGDGDVRTNRRFGYATKYSRRDIDPSTRKPSSTDSGTLFTVLLDPFRTGLPIGKQIQVDALRSRFLRRREIAK